MRRFLLNFTPLMLLCAAPSPLTTAQEKPPQWPLFKKHLIDAGVNESAAVADINRDGRADI